MILKFDDNSYMDIDSVTTIAKDKEDDFGIVALNGVTIRVKEKQYKIIQKAFEWANQHLIYDETMELIEK